MLLIYLLKENHLEVLKIVSVYGNKIYHCPGFLYCQYILLRKSAVKLSKKVGCGQTTMYRNLRRWNIDIRTRKEYTLSGKEHQNYGKFQSEETKKKISLANKGRIRTEEHSKKISETRKRNGLCMGKNHYFYGKHHTQETKDKISKNRTGKIMGEEHPNWKGGRYRNAEGYIYILKPEHPHANKQGYVFEHRLVIESFLKDYLTPKEVVHHINEITDDNRLSNLTLFKSVGYHSNYHKKLNKERCKS